MDSKRIEWVDVCKGIGIILVLLGHAPISPAFKNYIFSFHMPLFFFLSGYLFNIDKYSGYLSCAKNRIRKLIVPYIIFSFVSIILVCVINDSQLGTPDIIKFLKYLILSRRNETYYNGALWFLTSLFTVEMVYYILKKTIKNNLVLLGTVLIISFFGYLYSQILKYPILPWSLDYSAFYIVFYYFGSLFKSYGNRLKGVNILSIPLVVMNIAYLILDGAVLNFMGIFSKYILTEYLLTIMISLSGITTCVVIAKYFDTSKFLKLIGQNSMIIFLLHLPLCYGLIYRSFVVLDIKVQTFNSVGFVFTFLALIMLQPIIRYKNIK